MTDELHLRICELEEENKVLKDELMDLRKAIHSSECKAIYEAGYHKGVEDTKCTQQGVIDNEI